MNPLFRTFIQIVENETVVRAAEALHLTQPTLSRQIQQLESQLGVRLFDRIGKRLVLNHAGELVYGYAKQFVGLEQKMLEALNSFTDPEVGTIYLGAGLTPSIYLLPPVLARFRTLHPRVQVVIRTGSSSFVRSMLFEREIDLGIVTTVEDHEDLYCTPLYRDDLLLVAHGTHGLAQGRSASLAEVATHPFVVMRQGSGLRRLVEELFQERGLPLYIAMETDSLESINRMVQHAIGISIVPRSSVQDDLGAGKLTEIQLSDVELFSRTITLIERRGGNLPASTLAFRTFITSGIF